MKKLRLKKGEEYIKDIRFEILSYSAAIASSIVLTVAAKGKKSEALKTIKKVIALNSNYL